jgi:hypothetical protein
MEVKRGGRERKRESNVRNGNTRNKRNPREKTMRTQGTREMQLKKI